MIMNSCEEFKGIRNKMKADGQDWANHIARYCSCNAQIQAVLEFEERLDIEKMKKAVRLSVDAEPVLGCSFVEDPEEAYWERLKDIDSVEWCMLEETEDSADAVHKFITSTLEPELYQLQVRIIRSHEKDTLCVKINHACCDGGGIKEYLQVLADIYNHLCTDESYMPEVNNNCRGDTAKVYRKLGIADPRMAYNPQLAALKPNWVFPYNEGKPDKLKTAVRKIEKDQFNTISAYARENGATINDMILTAFYRTMFDMLLPEALQPMEIYVSVDLRRYLPQRKAAGICNLSGVVNARVERKEGETFSATLRRVSTVMNNLKRSNPGVHSAASMDLLRTMKYKDAAEALMKIRKRIEDSGKSSPILSNIGGIAQYPFRFGGSTVTDAYIITPAMYSPSFMLGASTYHNNLTLCVSYYEPSIHMGDIEKFMDILQNQLSSL
ncbi:condensation domain protein [Pseudobacteroides cellulosolvens ATCC 35603 = DSM 2933]|uniref:Condensation domain protein n=1 Tax=Pseudobacteroides cellulosolvens ATCC 35603 = DSM 2933 TaxID=398512 RepID=A0A0L6JSS7_9FIRM|nr:condensation domain protein [Pseudobacteroides cellulosolvens ATCC 35603 = DSM 2933]